ncbi:hypothetical protein BCR39DRAFT_531066 [Naematelia encephala]|uniref:Mediator of RNA polymerase II transcription subunit 21 n=1 Tax=Naematelia encephala TaxID=71784 RepID=A0A1Y2B514_9TREE|nr:hypothetical protein BCR39DRAFT_531066 [Naematelia encephala]
MPHEELSTDMDRITQLQDAILDLLTITSTSIEYITHRARFEQVSTSIPETIEAPHAPTRETYNEAIETFVRDLVRRAKDVELLIAALPNKDDNTSRAERLNELQNEMVDANAEYREALSQAESLLAELQVALAAALGNGVTKSISAEE